MSKFQKRIKYLLKEALGNQTIQEEVNVQKLFPRYEAGNQHYDLVIPNLNLIIECHGEQHRTLQSFGKSSSNPMTNLILQKRRDRRKEHIAIENEWSYLIIWYDELPKKDEDAKQFILREIDNAFQDVEDNDY